MAREIERKFLVSGNTWRRDADRGRVIRQAYLAGADNLSIRVRIIGNKQAFLTIKSRPALSRLELEYSIPVRDAQRLIRHRTGLLLVKRRHIVEVGTARFEIDVFQREHRGLVIAEVELPSERARFPRPTWLGKEVTGNRRYYNAWLARA